jgi:hypothetical protein
MLRTAACEAGTKLPCTIKRTRRHLFVAIGGTNRAFTATNTGSERALRPSAGFRTIPHGFRPGGAKRDAEIRSVIATARRRARTTREAIRHTLAGKPLATAP